MLILSPSWRALMGSTAILGHPEIESLESALRLRHDFKPEPKTGLHEFVRPCHPFEVTKPPVIVRLDADGDTWWLWGCRVDSNAPPPALVEAKFREAARIEFGDGWDTQKKKRLDGLRKKVKNDLADDQPYKLKSTGAIFFSPSSGRWVLLGTGAQACARDLSGRTEWLKIGLADFAQPPTEGNGKHLLALLRSKSEALPWPSGSAVLAHEDEGQHESASVKGKDFTAPADDLDGLIKKGWLPRTVDVAWPTISGSVDTTLRLVSLRFKGAVKDADPSLVVEQRLAVWLKCWAEAKARIEACCPDLKGPLEAMMEVDSNLKARGAAMEVSVNGQHVARLGAATTQEEEEEYATAVAVVRKHGKATHSLLQRKMNLGYGDAVKLMKRLEAGGVVGPEVGPAIPRAVLPLAGSADGG